MSIYKNIFVLILLLILTANSFGQNEAYKKAAVSNKIEIRGDIDVAWTYLSNLGNLQNLVPSIIEKSTLVGNGKGSMVTLTLKENRGVIVEEVITLNNKKRFISYRMISTPLPIKNYIASFTLNKIAANSFDVIFYVTYKVQEANRKSRMEAFNNLQKELLSNIKRITHEDK